MSTNKRSLILLTPPEPPAELIQKALDWRIKSDLHEFASNLETARAMWRKWRNFVEAPEFPERFRAAYVEEVGYEPDDDCGIGGDEIFAPEWPENLRPGAVIAARGWMKKDRADAEDGDANFLGEMGIAG